VDTRPDPGLKTLRDRGRESDGENGWSLALTCLVKASTFGLADRGVRDELVRPFT
jgi:hypothetical protein